MLPCFDHFRLALARITWGRWKGRQRGWRRNCVYDDRRGRGRGWEGRRGLRSRPELSDGGVALSHVWRRSSKEGTKGDNSFRPVTEVRKRRAGRTRRIKPCLAVLRWLSANVKNTVRGLKSEHVRERLQIARERSDDGGTSGLIGQGQVTLTMQAVCGPNEAGPQDQKRRRTKEHVRGIGYKLLRANQSQ